MDKIEFFIAETSDTVNLTFFPKELERLNVKPMLKTIDTIKRNLLGSKYVVLDNDTQHYLSTIPKPEISNPEFNRVLDVLTKGMLRYMYTHTDEHLYSIFDLLYQSEGEVKPVDVSDISYRISYGLLYIKDVNIIADKYGKGALLKMCQILTSNLEHKYQLQNRTKIKYLFSDEILRATFDESQNEHVRLPQFDGILYPLNLNLFDGCLQYEDDCKQIMEIILLSEQLK